MANDSCKYNNTLWENIKFKLECEILNGKYKSSEKVPSISELSVIYGIGKSTSKKVLESLCKDGIITKQRGVGYFVKPLVKNRLNNKHLNNLNIGIKEYITMAKELNIKEDELKEVLIEKIKEVYSR